MKKDMNIACVAAQASKGNVVNKTFLSSISILACKKNIRNILLKASFMASHCAVFYGLLLIDAYHLAAGGAFAMIGSTYSIAFIFANTDYFFDKYDEWRGTRYEYGNPDGSVN